MRFWIRQCRTKDSGPSTDVPRPMSAAMMYLRLAADQQEELVADEISRPRRVAAFMACAALAVFVPLGLAKNAFAQGSRSHASGGAAKVDLARKHETGGTDQHRLHQHKKKRHRHKGRNGDKAGGGGSNSGGTQAGGGNESSQAGGGGSNTGGTQAGGGNESTQAGGGGSNTGGTQAGGGNEST